MSVFWLELGCTMKYSSLDFPRAQAIFHSISLPSLLYIYNQWFNQLLLKVNILKLQFQWVDLDWVNCCLPMLDISRWQKFTDFMASCFCFHGFLFLFPTQKWPKQCDTRVGRELPPSLPPTLPPFLPPFFFFFLIFKNLYWSQFSYPWLVF